MQQAQNIAFYTFTIVILVFLALGWSQRDEYWLNAEHGAGYALGIVGGTMMLLLLLYPVRKHWRRARNWFHIKHWFRMHMIFGVLGPVLILFHSNFQLGSLNSTIALFCMLLVSLSGLIGRYAYRKIHRGLYGERIKFSDLISEYETIRNLLIERNKEAASHYQSLLKIGDETLTNRHHLSAARKHLHRLRYIRREMRRELNDPEQEQYTKVAIHFSNQLITLNNYIQFERVFSLWHLFHMPIFFMMIISAIVHILVVHMY